MENKFKLEADYGVIKVEPNYTNGYKVKEKEVIMIGLSDDDNLLNAGITVDQAKELINYLSQVVEYIEYAPKKGDWANIIGGKFKGFSGKIFDIDEFANIREAIIEIPKTQENDKFYIYVSLCDLEVVRR